MQKALYWFICNAINNVEQKSLPVKTGYNQSLTNLQENKKTNKWNNRFQN